MPLNENGLVSCDLRHRKQGYSSGDGLGTRRIFPEAPSSQFSMWYPAENPEAKFTFPKKVNWRGVGKERFLHFWDLVILTQRDYFATLAIWRRRMMPELSVKTCERWFWRFIACLRRLKFPFALVRHVKTGEVGIRPLFTHEQLNLVAMKCWQVDAPTWELPTLLLNAIQPT